MEKLLFAAVAMLGVVSSLLIAYRISPAVEHDDSSLARLHSRIARFETVNSELRTVTGSSSLTYGYNNETGIALPVHVNEYGYVSTQLEAPRTAFGEIKTESMTPNIQLTFQYNKNPDYITDITNGSATVTVDPPFLNLRSGTTANSCAQFESVNYAKYRPGQGIIARFTAVFDTPQTNTTALIGIGDATNGFFFGYQGTTFGLLRRYGGIHDIYSLDITTAADTAGSVTLTLNGQETVVTVTNSNVDSTTASEIATAAIPGWKTSSNGSTVVFVCVSSTPHNGLFEITNDGGTSINGTFTRVVTGLAPSENFIPTAQWNIDRVDGAGGTLNPTSFSLTPQNGNVYQIQYQWLGFGAIVFGIERTNSGLVHPVHRIQYSNAYTNTSVFQPSNHLSAIICSQQDSTHDIRLKTPSLSASVEGVHRILGSTKSVVSAGKSVGTGVTAAILSIQSALTFQNRFNYVPVIPVFVYVSDRSSGSDSSIFRIYKGGYATAALGYENVDIDRSVVQAIVDPDDAFDTSNAVLVATVVVADKGSEHLNLDSLGIQLLAGETLTITAKSDGGTNQITASITWREDF